MQCDLFVLGHPSSVKGMVEAVDGEDLDWLPSCKTQ